MYFCCFCHSLLFLKSKGFLGILDLRYISRSQFFFTHSILTRPSEEGLSVTDQLRGNNILIVFRGKNNTKRFWFVRSYVTMQPSPCHSRVFVILHSTTFHVGYNFFYLVILFCTRAYRYIAFPMSINRRLHYIFITWFKLSYQKSKRKFIKGLVSNLKEKYSSVLQFFFL